MIIDYNKPGPWSDHPAVVHRASDGEEFPPRMIIWIDTDTGDYIALGQRDGHPYYDIEKEAFDTYTGSFDGPVYIMMSNGERLPTNERADR